MAQKKFGPALAFCDVRLKKNPRDALAQVLMGQVYAAQKDYKRAEEAFTKATELQPEWPVPLSNLARLYVVEGQTTTAIKKLEEAVKSKPDNVTACLLLGRLYVRTKAFDKAVAMYEKVIERQPGNWMVSNDLAFLLADRAKSKNDLTRAHDLAQKALNARPNEPSIEDTLGWICYKQGDTNNAADLVGKAYGRMFSNPTVNYHMGMIAYKAGRIAEAKQYLAKATNSNEEFDGKEDAQKTLGKL